jgi:uncharacterized protein (TIGR02466 family)
MNDTRPRSEIGSLFAVPLIICRLPEPEAMELNAELESFFVSCRDEGKQYANPEPYVARNQALFESNFSLFDWPQECVQKLRRFCLGQLYQAIGELNGYDDATLRRLHVGVESWFHVTEQGGFFATHNHPMHSWSGVYCVRHDGDDPQTDSGRLTFINPNLGASSYMDSAVFRMRQPFAQGVQKLRLEPGQLVLFPSWVLHEVMPYEGTTRRITVAFNARFRMAGSQG